MYSKLEDVVRAQLLTDGKGIGCPGLSLHQADEKWDVDVNEDERQRISCCHWVSDWQRDLESLQTDLGLGLP